MFDFLDQLKPLCEKYNCAIADLSLAWILAQDEKVVLLSGATSPDQIRANTHAADIDLSAEDVQMMREMAEALDR